KNNGHTFYYKKTSSGSGVRELFQKRVEFAGTDAFLTDTEMLEAEGSGGVVHVPLVMGAVVATYNLPNVKGSLRLNGQQLAGIYLGEIKRWNDQSLTTSNPGAGLPDLPIAVIYRSEKSGTTSIWTDYLDKVSLKWHAPPGPGKGNIVKWPVGTGAAGNDGVADAVEKTPGAIGYVELSYALGKGLKYA